MLILGLAWCLCPQLGTQLVPSTYHSGVLVPNVLYPEENFLFHVVCLVDLVFFFFSLSLPWCMKCPVELCWSLQSSAKKPCLFSSIPLLPLCDNFNSARYSCFWSFYFILQIQAKLCSLQSFWWCSSQHISEKCFVAVAGERGAVGLLWQGAGQVLCYPVSVLQKVLCKYFEPCLWFLWCNVS